jgi:hypothetical protein
MQNACAVSYRACVPHVQIRNVPPKLHRKLKARAAAAGMSLSEYLLSELERGAERPTMEEWVESARSGKRYRFEKSAAELIREERDARS